MATDGKKRATRQSRRQQTAQPLRGGTARQGRLFNPSQAGPQPQLFNPDDPNEQRTFTQPGGDESAFGSSNRPSPTREVEAERDRDAREEARRRRLARAAREAQQRGSRLDVNRRSSGRLLRGRRGNT